MGTLTAPEIREYHLSPKDRAIARDSYVREFERQWNNWAELGKVLFDFEHDKDFLILGFSSYHQWLLAAAPRSRSYCYLVSGRYGELKVDFSDEELSEIDLDSTTTLRKLSPALRKDPEVRETAKKKPKELRRLIVEKHPEQHIEDVEARALNFTTGQARLYDEAVEAWRVFNNPEASPEEIMEDIVNDWLDSPVNEDSPYSRRERAAQLEATSPK